jgi:hypothetical protein
MSTSTVWAVSAGSYSDYNVIAVFPSEELAEAHLAQLKEADGYYGGEAFVESFPFCPEPMEPTTVYTKMATVEDGSLLDGVRQDVGVEWPYENPPGRRPRGETIPRKRQGVLFVRVRGSSLSAVDKAFADRLAEAKAQT